MTRSTSKPLEDIEWKYNNNYVHKIDEEFYRIINMYPFTYLSNKINIFRIVLEWEVLVKTEDKKIDILTLTATDEYVIDSENEEKEEDFNVIERILIESYLKLAEENERGNKDHAIMIHFPEADLSEHASQILLLIRRNK